MIAPTLFSGEYVEAVIAVAEKIENKHRTAKFVLIATAFGVSERQLKRVFHGDSLRKSCQYLVDRGLMEAGKNQLTASAFPVNWANVPSYLGNSPDNTIQHNTIHHSTENTILHNFVQDGNFGTFSDPDADCVQDGFHSLADQSALRKILDQFFDHMPENLRKIFDTPPNIDTRLIPGAKIKSTSQIPGIILHLSNKQMEMVEQNRNYIKSFFKEPGGGLSDDLVDRIVLMPLTIGINPFADGAWMVKEWKIECKQYKENISTSGEQYQYGRVLRGKSEKGKMWVCLASIVQEKYETCEVQWLPVMAQKIYKNILQLTKAIKAELKKIQQKVDTPFLFTERELANTATVSCTAGRAVGGISLPPSAPDISPESDEAGSHLLTNISEKVGEGRFALWFGNDADCKVDEASKQVIFYVRNEFAMKSIRRHCGLAVREVIAEQMPGGFRVFYEVKPAGDQC